MKNVVFAQEFCIDHTHPAFAGHFPGQPLVPAVMLLEQVALALQAWQRQRLTCVVQAKFMAPLLPDETAEVCLTRVEAQPSRVRFEIERAGMVLAAGVVEGATA